MLSHSEVAVSLFGKGAAFHMIGLNNNEIGYCPERRLWCAVIISAMEEYIEWLSRINTSWAVHQRPVNRNFRFSLMHIRKQCKTEWFHMICEMADFSVDRVARKFDALDREFCLSQIPFEDEPERFMSQWALRKISKQKIIS